MANSESTPPADNTTESTAETAKRTRTTLSTFEPLLTLPHPTDLDGCRKRDRDFDTAEEFVNREIESLQAQLKTRIEFSEKLTLRANELFDHYVTLRQKHGSSKK